MEIKTRKEALSQSLKFYFTGKPCKKGHRVKRIATNGNCVECVVLRAYRDSKVLLNNHVCHYHSIKLGVPLITKKEALSRFLKVFFTGENCKNGHITKRRVENGECCKCRAIKATKKNKTQLDNHVCQYHSITLGIPLITKKESQERNLDVYFTGKVCKNGHTSKRLINGGCQLCPDKGDKSEYNKSYYLLHKEEIAKSNKLDYDNNPDKYRDRRRAQFINNPEKRREWARAGYARNPGIGRLRAVNRRAKKLERTPAWSDSIKTKEFYQNVPDKMQVDHIIPLLGKLVSGLHNYNNLQYLGKLENIRKKNKFIPYTEVNGIKTQVEDKYLIV